MHRHARRRRRDGDVSRSPAFLRRARRIRRGTPDQGSERLLRGLELHARRQRRRRAPGRPDSRPSHAPDVPGDLRPGLQRLAGETLGTAIGGHGVIDPCRTVARSWAGDAVVIGGGIAGFITARALEAPGLECTLGEAEGYGAGQSGSSHGYLHQGFAYAGTQPVLVRALRGVDGAWTSLLASLGVPADNATATICFEQR